MSCPPVRSLSILDHFSALTDPRQRWRVAYPLPEILLVVLCATLCGMDDFVEIKLWGEQRIEFLRRFLDEVHTTHVTVNTCNRFTTSGGKFITDVSGTGKQIQYF